MGDNNCSDNDHNDNHRFDSYSVNGDLYVNNIFKLMNISNGDKGRTLRNSLLSTKHCIQTATANTR